MTLSTARTYDFGTTPMRPGIEYLKILKLGVSPFERVLTTESATMQSELNQEFDPSTGPVQTIRKVQRILGRLYHDTNNPLAIVSGNAQFLLEVAEAMELDDDLVQPMRDIEEASERVAEGLRDISRLRDRINNYLDRLDASGTS